MSLNKQRISPALTLELGDMDSTARLTSSTGGAGDEASIKKYHKHLRTSSFERWSPLFEEENNPALTIAMETQALPWQSRSHPPSSALPRLDSVGGKEAAGPRVEGYFSLGGGWEQYAPPPSAQRETRADSQSNFAQTKQPLSMSGASEILVDKAHQSPEKQDVPLNGSISFDWQAELQDAVARWEASYARYLAVSSHYTATGQNIWLPQEHPALRNARVVRSEGFWQSLRHEGRMLRYLADGMWTSEAGTALVGLVPSYDEWRLRTAAQTLKRARVVRRGREEEAHWYLDKWQMVMCYEYGMW